VLDAKLFYEGQKPAVDVGTSVSRVGGKTQAHALREAAEAARLDYAQFLELEMFTRFGGMPDARARTQLTRGARIRAILGQPQHALDIVGRCEERAAQIERFNCDVLPLLANLR
jgi:F-type H+/Na+-transporting ATPase subunit alpha